MVVDQTGQHALTLEVDDFGLRPGQTHDIAIRAHLEEETVFDGNGSCARVGSIERG
jgi:hypothetical protein